jgi:hypothetical protein
MGQNQCGSDWKRQKTGGGKIQGTGRENEAKEMNNWICHRKKQRYEWDKQMVKQSD